MKSKCVDYVCLPFFDQFLQRRQERVVTLSEAYAWLDALKYNGPNVVLPKYGSKKWRGEA